MEERFPKAMDTCLHINWDIRWDVTTKKPNAVQIYIILQKPRMNSSEASEKDLQKHLTQRKRSKPG